LWLLTVSIVVEEVATADLFSTNALDVEDVNRTDLDVVGSKLVGEEDRKKLLLVMMHQLMILMVPQLRNMVLPLMMLMVPPQKDLLTMMTTPLEMFL